MSYFSKQGIGLFAGEKYQKEFRFLELPEIADTEPVSPMPLDHLRQPEICGTWMKELGYEAYGVVGSGQKDPGPSWENNDYLERERMTRVPGKWESVSETLPLIPHPTTRGTGSVVDAPSAMRGPASLSEPQGVETGMNKGRGSFEGLLKENQVPKMLSLAGWRVCAGGKRVRDRLKGEFEPNGARLCGRCRSVRAPQQAWLSTLFGGLIKQDTVCPPMSFVVPWWRWTYTCSLSRGVSV